MSQVRSTPRASDERAAAEVIGTLMLVGLTVTVAAGMGAVVLGAVPGPSPPPGFDLAVSLAPACPWGDGNERVVLQHRGGEALRPGGVTIVTMTGNGTVRDGLDGFEEGGDLDGRFEIGERWQGPHTIVQAGDLVHVEVVIDTGSPEVAFGGHAQAVPDLCAGGP